MCWYIFPPKRPYPPTRQDVTTQMTRIWVPLVTFSTAVTNYKYSSFQKYGYVIYRITLDLRKCNLRLHGCICRFHDCIQKIWAIRKQSSEILCKEATHILLTEEGEKTFEEPNVTTTCRYNNSNIFWLICCLNRNCWKKKSILHSEERASWYIIIKANEMHYFSNLFW